MWMSIVLHFKCVVVSMVTLTVPTVHHDASGVGQSREDGWAALRMGSQVVFFSLRDRNNTLLEGTSHI